MFYITALLPWKARKLALTGAVMPIINYAVAVWGKATVLMRQKLDSWQMGIVASMLHCPPSTSHACLQQELGIQPMHVVCDIATLTYWHRIIRMSPDRLVTIVSKAWKNTSNPWQQNINKLLHQYKVDKDIALTLDKTKFSKYLAILATTYTRQLWQTRENRGSATLTQYRQTYSNSSLHLKRKAHAYFTHLGHQGRGRAAELYMQLRLACLPLQARVVKKTRDETDTVLTQRRLCPCCQDGAETNAHFLLDCSRYNGLRTRMMQELQKCDQWSNFSALPLDVQATQLINPDFWQVLEPTEAVATYIMEAWKARSSHMHNSIGLLQIVQPFSHEHRRFTPNGYSVIGYGHDRTS